ncbi:allantoate amidohydrolase [Acidiferrimicrobium sp. IK]|uniref:allantoate amidohydrolase n=1 Tax=Acidiferrimicrobium sp. IK TaxID=2871700 RepID=UPI0021CB6C6D|nr:allantoate amidohydrolase [Acidiferrimicrobium sp. IK]MCU4183581.1 allantoate amidohydrolase [Acidiferrimicrobium sp. IK]
MTSAAGAPGAVPDGAGFDRAWSSLLPVGRAPTGGYHRLAWSDADLGCREWFRQQADAHGLTLDEDHNGNQWAWWGEPGPDAVVTGSHLDSVPGGGAFDGPLGVVSAFLAVAALQAAGVAPGRPVAVVNFSDEEGGRFGLACLGSRLMAGEVDPDTALARTDPDGVTLSEARSRAGFGDRRPGPDPDRLGRIGIFVELHIEQGRRLAVDGVPVGVATAVWPHGRWRLDFRGEGNHAGTTAVADRHDPVLPLAHAVLAAREAAATGDALATIGRVEAHPGATNAIASRATAWLDARAPLPEGVRAAVGRVEDAARAAAGREGVALTVAEESWSGGAEFRPELRAALAAVVEGRLGKVAQLPTGAGHDAAVLAASVPTAMLFVRNPTGISHDPAEHATRADCLAGVDALVAVLASLCR